MTEKKKSIRMSQKSNKILSSVIKHLFRHYLSFIHKEEDNSGVLDETVHKYFYLSNYEKKL